MGAGARRRESGGALGGGRSSRRSGRRASLAARLDPPLKSPSAPARAGADARIRPRRGKANTGARYGRHCVLNISVIRIVGHARDTPRAT
ncbi:hypothetical protein AQ860_02765 [Burkholderia pseudomallei]|nr:hypothetical protein AQ760_13780 [Burkholderia pseudomallei]OMZ16176.1 hypothetical protein AQ859_13550 [Burkholderia pseudomallei]OMZ30481.1 hypothetical protein AQ860_02765 [Burkholderia pseudomallei]